MNDFLMHQVSFISAFGDNYILVIFFALFFFFYLKIHRHLTSAIILLFSTSSVLYSFFLKGLFLHPRPDNYINSSYIFDVYSFPSSHVTFYTVFWGFLLYLVYKYKKEAKLFYGILKWVCIYFITLIGASRILLNAHFLKDVIAGYFFGGIFLFLLIFLDKKTQNMFTKNDNKNN